LVMEEFGKGMVVEPFLNTAVIGGGLIADAGSDVQKQKLLPTVMEGQLQLAFAFTEAQSRYNLADVDTRAELQGDHYVINGKKSVVLNGESADKFIVSVRTAGDQRDRDGISLLILDADTAGISRQGYATIDGQRAAEVSFDNVKVPTEQLLGAAGQALPSIEKIIDRATLAVCAEAVGSMEVVYKKTVEYTQTRKQFGVSLASFQALQHRMVDMFIEYEQARSILMMAAMQLDAGEGLAPKAISAAKSRVGKAARKVGQEAVQLHGGIGVTDELDIGHYFKRLTSVQYLYGSTDFHTQRFASL